MGNLTITVDDETLKRARIRALERGESVNDYLADRLRKYAGDDGEGERQQRTVTRLLALSESMSGTSGGSGRSRQDLYDDRRIS